MIRGTFIANLDPPFVEFISDGNTRVRRPCTIEELRAILIEMEALHKTHAWPVREYVLRLPVELSREKLLKLGILNPRASLPLGN